MQANRDNGMSQKPSTVFNQRIRMKRKVEQCELNNTAGQRPLCLTQELLVSQLEEGKKAKQWRATSVQYKTFAPRIHDLQSLLLQTDFETIDNAHLKE